MLELFLVSLLFAHLNLGVVLINRKHGVEEQKIEIQVEHQQEQTVLVSTPIERPKPEPFFGLFTFNWLAPFKLRINFPPLPARAPPAPSFT